MAPLWTLLRNNSLSTLMVLQRLQRMCSVTICRGAREISRQLEPLERTLWLSSVSGSGGFAGGLPNLGKDI